MSEDGSNSANCNKNRKVRMTVKSKNVLIITSQFFFVDSEETLVFVYFRVHFIKQKCVKSEFKHPTLPENVIGYLMTVSYVAMSMFVIKQINL